MKSAIKRILAFVGRHLNLEDVRLRQSELQLLTAKIIINQMKTSDPVVDINATEFKVFSQFGDDGILQYLIHHLKIAPEHRSFVEFGVENYEESNTRFLLMNDNWRGVVIDGSTQNIDHIFASSYFWKYRLTAVAAFIDAGNINNLINSAGFSGDIGLLSIDIDGNDYWVWDSIHVVNPIIIVAEYNGVFGPKHAVSIPYDPTFRRSAAHHSNMYWGCSLAALRHLATKKGYVFVGCNSAGNNAYFIRQDRMLPVLSPLSLGAAFVDPHFRESRDQAGRLTYLAGPDRLDAIKPLRVTDVISGKVDSISNFYRMDLK